MATHREQQHACQSKIDDSIAAILSKQNGCLFEDRNTNSVRSRQARLDRSAAANDGGPLRRSSRKAAKRFVRSMDDAEWEQSDNDRTSYSGDEDSGTPRRDKVEPPSSCPPTFFKS